MTRPALPHSPLPDRDADAPGATISASAASEAVSPPVFDPAFQNRLGDLFRWRRDVRRFRKEPIDPEALEELVGLATLAPSVGHSQPWRFVSVDAPERRQAVIDNFSHCNAAALARYDGDEATLYARLKLAGLREAPHHLAVFCETATRAGRGLGRMTMPETLVYSVVGAMQNLALAARARGLGVGWVSILDPAAMSTCLDVPPEWHFVAYLCIGTPEEEHLDPELERHGWQQRLPLDSVFFRR